MDSTLAAKLNLLKLRMKEAKAIKNRLDQVVKSDTPVQNVEEVPDKNKEKRTREKAFINAIANIPVYKSSDYYKLDILAKKLPIIDTDEWRKNKLAGVLHKSTMKLAVKRMGEVLTRLYSDYRRERRLNAVRSKR